ncbi:hypothetical protein QWY93_19280 [Echinicola jeungdonensis]|uniref:hypothetical protein n=1 Tax=Echinicola jeungdonensis TaxID=709343 RepID=UPI0025B45086|nr:hypothetical protein [Echinicola jeungdonensis]MDN3671402.1 hypothetical protein [Echinicola jeungdonensis]
MSWAELGSGKNQAAQTAPTPPFCFFERGDIPYTELHKEQKAYCLLALTYASGLG